MTYDALIIGAGPAGATAALRLARAGWAVCIVEKQLFPRRKVCGEFISATSLPLLRDLGLADDYLTHAGPAVKRVAVYASTSMLASNMPLSNLHNKWGRAYGREHLDASLLAAAVAAGATLHQPAHVTELHHSEVGYSCSIVSRDKPDVSVSATIVINAHGSWEQGVTGTLKAKQNYHKPSDLLAFKAHFTETALPSDLMPLLAFPGGYGGLAHTDHGRVTLSCCIRRDSLERARRTYTGVTAGEAVLQHIMGTTTGVKLALGNAKREGSWLGAGPIQPGIRKRYADSIFYVGNIAGEAHPIVAEGISMAMQSAWVLSEILIADSHNIRRGDVSCINAAGATYSKQWAKHFSRRIRAAAIFSRIAISPFATKLLLPIFNLFPQLITLGARLSGKVEEVVT